jgi:hypothetical protein
METRRGRRPAGAISLIALCLISALGVVVGSYVALVTHTQQLGTRQFQDGRARELAQAGLEEALWALNENNWTASGPAGATSWTTSGSDRSVVLNYGSLGHGATGQVSLTVANYASAGPAWPTIAAEAVVTLTDGRTIRKKLAATTGPAPLFGNAIASANAGVSFVAGGTVDSWNSDPDNNPGTAAVGYSFTAGNAANYAAVVAGRDDGTYGVVLTQALVNGYVATFGQPVGYSVSAVPPGRVKGPTTTPLINIDPARLTRSAFVPVAPVFTVVLPPASGPAFGGLIGTILDLVGALLGAAPAVEVYKTTGDFTIQGLLPILPYNFVVNRPLKLIVDGDFEIGNWGSITITPTGSLQIFVSGDCTIGGNGIDNQNTAPASCAIFCTSTSTSDTLQYTTTAAFRGVIYCENKPIDIRQNATFYGALLSSRQVSFTAGATAPVFHYDTALRTTRFSQITTPYVISQLTEP